MNPEIIDYILFYFSHLMNRNEAMAWRHYTTSYKTKDSNVSDNRRKLYFEKGWMTEEPEVLKLLDNGIDNFRLKTAERIVREDNDKIFYNNCPKCGKLARTPKAKQCRFCNHDWH